MNIITTLYSNIYKLYFRLRYGQKLNGTIYRNTFIGAKGNEIQIEDYFANNKVKIVGKGNRINIEGRFDGTRLIIMGNNNRLIVGQGSNIHCSTIIFRGDNQEIVIGKYARLHNETKLVSHGNGNYIHIGEDTGLSDGTNVWNSDTHQIMDETGKIINPSRPVVIEDHVWVGRGVSITKGAHIGEGSVIGMASVVSRSIPAHSIAAGVPAKVLKENIKWDLTFIKEVKFTD